MLLSTTSQSTSVDRTEPRIARHSLQQIWASLFWFTRTNGTHFPMRVTRPMIIINSLRRCRLWLFHILPNSICRWPFAVERSFALLHGKRRRWQSCAPFDIWSIAPPPDFVFFIIKSWKKSIRLTQRTARWNIICKSFDSTHSSQHYLWAMPCPTVSGHYSVKRCPGQRV